MDTEELMQIALDMSGFEEIPADSQIFVRGDDIKRVLFGVDVDAAGLMLAKQLNFDAVIAHHPPGNEAQIYGMPKVMLRHIEQMKSVGISEKDAEKALEVRRGKVSRQRNVINYERVTSVAKLLEIPFLNIHTPVDAITKKYFDDYIDSFLSLNENAKVSDLIKSLNEIDEISKGLTKPALRIGDEESPVGKFFVAISAGTSGGAAIAKAYFKAGINTLLYMHLGEGDYKKLKKEKIKGNLIVTGHMPSDSIGINIYLNELEKRGIFVQRFSGVIA
ncbi:MAG: Nif3-like dinuclear metal center hexameric protein [Actinobacteria bacterium]|nr:Nif3-like dinuclear metal center hexameric protein [Actinomycetota bacterium]